MASDTRVKRLAGMEWVGRPTEANGEPRADHIHNLGAVINRGVRHAKESQPLTKSPSWNSIDTSRLPGYVQIPCRGRRGVGKELHEIECWKPGKGNSLCTRLGIHALPALTVSLGSVDAYDRETVHLNRHSAPGDTTMTAD